VERAVREGKNLHLIACPCLQTWSLEVLQAIRRKKSIHTFPPVSTLFPKIFHHSSNTPIAEKSGDPILWEGAWTGTEGNQGDTMAPKRLVYKIWGVLVRTTPKEAGVLENLSLLLDRGVPPGQALTSVLEGGKESPHLPAPGERISPALVRAGLVSPGEGAFLEELEEVGRLPLGLKALARFQGETHRLLRSALARGAYPLLILHLALVPLQIPTLLSRGFQAALTSLLLWTALLEALLLSGAWLVLRAWEGGKVERLPLLGPWFLMEEKRKALFLLEELHGGGVLWDRALLGAARGVRAPHLKERLIEGAGKILQGRPPSEVLLQALDLEEPCRGWIQTGERAGSLQESLAQCRAALERLSSQRAGVLSKGIGSALYVLAVAFTILVLVRAILAIYSPTWFQIGRGL